MRYIKLTIIVALLIGIAGLSGNRADASGMGFRFNRGVLGPQGSGFRGVNLVALPADNPYVNAEDICIALNLTAVSGAVVQWDPVSGSIYWHSCGGGGAFTLLPLHGVLVFNNAGTSGVIAGSHPDASVTYSHIGPVAAGFKGTNLYSVPFHTTAVNAEDLCIESGLAALSLVIRSDGSNAITHSCGGGGPFTLVPGEAVLIQPVSPTVSFVPPHF